MKSSYMLTTSVALLLSIGGAFGAPEDDHQHGHTQEKEQAKHDGQDESVSLADLLKVRCEHNVLTYTCDACRFEIGFVRLTPELFLGAGAEPGLIRTEQVAKRKAERFFEATGEIRLNDNATVHVTPRIQGIIRKVNVDVGTKVKRDDILFEMESVELGDALGAYVKSRTLTELSRKNYEREKTLFDRKVSSELDLIEAQMRHEEHKTDFEAAEHKLHVMGLTEEDVAAIKPDGHAGLTGKLPFRAPIDGVIIERHAAIGESAAPGDDVMLLADLTTVWVWLDIYDRDLAPLLEESKKSKVPVAIETGSFPDRTFPGSIDYVGATMKQETRTVKARAIVANPEALLRPGMFCKARVALSADEEVLAIAREALLSDDGRDFVFKQVEDEYYVRWPVRKGRNFATVVEILTGLEADDTVVSRGAFLLKSDVLRKKMGAGCAD